MRLLFQFRRIVLSVSALSFAAALLGDQLDRHAVAVHLALPEPSPSSMLSAEKGIVCVLLRVEIDGSATILRIHGASSPRFIERVQEVVPRWKFQPAMRQSVRSLDVLEYFILFDPTKPAEIHGPIYGDLGDAEPGATANPDPGEKESAKSTPLERPQPGG